jgi:cysteine sulfinate desulfinase/cysteine desulfurase-like protein
VLLPELEKKMDADTFLLCCVVANNETGVHQDIAAVTRTAHQHDVLVLSDCVQALGKIPIDVHQWGIDYASFSAQMAALNYRGIAVSAGSACTKAHHRRVPRRRPFVHDRVLLEIERLHECRRPGRNRELEDPAK